MGPADRIARAKITPTLETIQRSNHNLLGDPRYPDTRDSATAIATRKRVNDGLKTRLTAALTRFAAGLGRSIGATHGLPLAPEKARGFMRA